MVKLAPSLLAADYGKLSEQIKEAELAGAEYLHLDIMDGHFVPNISYGSDLVKALRKESKMIFDVHLMITDPDKFIPHFVEAGADLITVHEEACIHLHRTVQVIKEYKKQVGVALNPATPVSTLEDILEELDLVLIMSVNPGFGGQKFIPSALNKIEILAQIIKERGLKIDIQVDGGINPETAALAAAKGANILVAGSAIFGQSSIETAIKNIRQSINNRI